MKLDSTTEPVTITTLLARLRDFRADLKQTAQIIADDFHGFDRELRDLIRAAEKLGMGDDR